MSDALPAFRYHPDPIATGSIVADEAECCVCQRVRTHRYEGPTYAVDFDEDPICPWCIADGSAAAHFDGEFTDVDRAPKGVPEDVIEVIATRTPGFSAWQQDHWLYHCDDGAAFLGRAGTDEMRAHPDAWDSIRHGHAQGWTEEELEAYRLVLHPDGDHTAYLFRCLHCGTHLAYTDAA